MIDAHTYYLFYHFFQARKKLILQKEGKNLKEKLT